MHERCLAVLEVSSIYFEEGEVEDIMAESPRRGEGKIYMIMYDCVNDQSMSHEGSMFSGGDGGGATNSGRSA